MLPFFLYVTFPDVLLAVLCYLFPALPSHNVTFPPNHSMLPSPTCYLPLYVTSPPIHPIYVTFSHMLPSPYPLFPICYLSPMLPPPKRLPYVTCSQCYPTHYMLPFLSPLLNIWCLFTSLYVTYPYMLPFPIQSIYMLPFLTSSLAGMLSILYVTLSTSSSASSCYLDVTCMLPESPLSPICYLFPLCATWLLPVSTC